MSTLVCPSCGEKKTKRAAVCADCRKTANELGVSVLTAVSTPAHPFTQRTPKQNSEYHGKLRDIALLEKPELAGGPLWTHERKLKKWALAHVAKMIGRPVESSTELSEIEFERMNEWLGEVIDDMRHGKHRPR